MVCVLSLHYWKTIFQFYQAKNFNHFYQSKSKKQFSTYLVWTFVCNSLELRMLLTKLQLRLKNHCAMFVIEILTQDQITKSFLKSTLFLPYSLVRISMWAYKRFRAGLRLDVILKWPVCPPSAFSYRTFNFRSRAVSLVHCCFKSRGPRHFHISLTLKKFRGYETIIPLLNIFDGTRQGYICRCWPQHWLTSFEYYLSPQETSMLDSAQFLILPVFSDTH